MDVPRVVSGIGGTVVGTSCGDAHSLVATVEGRVLAVGLGQDGCLGLGAGVEEALTPMAIDGITAGEGADVNRVEELGRLIEESETKNEEALVRHAAVVEEASTRYAEELRRIAEDKERHKAEKAALEKKIADKATEDAREGKEGKE